MAHPSGATPMHTEEGTAEKMRVRLTNKRTGDPIDLSVYDEFTYLVKNDVDDADVDARFEHTGTGAAGDILYVTDGTDGELTIQLAVADTAEAGRWPYKLIGILPGSLPEVLAKGPLTVGNN